MSDSNSSKSWSLSTLILYSALGFGLILLLMALLGPRLVEAFHPLPEDTGSSWYYWQLGLKNNAGRIAVWTGYALHQIFVWATFFSARKKRDKSISDKGDFFNLLMLGGNFFFVLLHLLQTHLWYDGLAMDVPIWTSQGSVIVMLVLLLVMEMPRRGLFWGKGHRVAPGLLQVLHRWHGPFISWALVYTFWFHPMEGNWGLLSGFVYMFLLFTQLNLFGTKAHTRKGWVVVLESFVVVHGTLISLYKHLDAWPLFLFGFLIMFLFTQMHSFKIPLWGKILILLASIALLIWVYSSIRGWNHVYETVFIPVALYGGALFLLLLGKIFGSGKKEIQP